MKNIMHKIGKISSFLTKYIGVIIIAFSVLAFFWRDGFAWTTKYTSVFLGVAMFGMGLTIRMEDFKVVFSRPKEVLIGFVSQYDHAADRLDPLYDFKTSDGTGTWCDPGRLLSRRNGEQCDHVYCRGRCGTFCWYDDRFHFDRSADDTASGLYSGRNLGGSVFLGNGDLSGKSNPDPGTSWNFDPDTLWKAN